MGKMKAKDIDLMNEMESNFKQVLSKPKFSSGIEPRKPKKVMCAVCGDKNQTNVILKWKRDRDNVVFHVCALCAESDKVNANSVLMMSQGNKYISYEE